MNRRDLLKVCGGGAVLLGTSTINGHFHRTLAIENPNTRDARVRAVECKMDEPHAWFNEALAREIIAETGEWKEHILSRRNSSQPIVVTRLGCCGCEITLAPGAHHPNWTYRLRPLTKTEYGAFKEEYGNCGPLLLGARFSTAFEVRGFILNGRFEGWNLSTRSRNA